MNGNRWARFGAASGFAFGAGITWSALAMLAQPFQVGVANDRGGAAPAALLWAATAVRGGPLASDGRLSFALDPSFLLWLVPATVVMVRGDGRRSRRRGPCASDQARDRRAESDLTSIRTSGRRR